MREYQTNKLHLKFDYETMSVILIFTRLNRKQKERNISVRRFWTTYQKSSISLRYNGYMEILLWSY